jgi:hypothetical protein
MMSFLSSLWARIAAVGAILAAALFFLARVFKAGGDAERLRSAKAALDHQTNTASQVRTSDEAAADPASPRARRMRRQFQRDDDAGA